MNDQTYLDLEYDAYQARRRRTRMERLRRKVRLWKLAACLLALALAAALCLLAGSSAEAAEPPAPEPVHIVELLTAEVPPAPAAEPEPQPQYARIIENATVTHYCICERCCGKAPDHPAYGITASGRPAKPYVSIAVDPALIPLDSTVWLDFGDGVLQECRADDTGSSVSGAHIDLCVSSHQEALSLGVRTAAVYVEVPA